MKLITLNAWQGRLFRNFIPFLGQQDADIICLQELNNSQEAIGDWRETFSILKEVLRVTKLEYQYFSPTYAYDFMGVEVLFGNGIISRYPLSNQQTIFTHGEYSKIVRASDAISNTRNAQIVSVASPKGNLKVVNTHAHWDSNPMGTDLSKQRLEKLIPPLKSIDDPLIIAGDFNLKSESDAIKYFKKELNVKDLTLESGISNTLNNLVTAYKVDCDHIFINDKIKVTDLKLNSDLLSDHKAMILDFDLALK